MLDLPNTVLIPHITKRQLRRIEMGESNNSIETFLDGHNPPNELYKNNLAFFIRVKNSVHTSSFNFY